MSNIATPTPGLRARHKEATRAALIETAGGLFAEHGYGDVSIEQIVRGAGVTRGALYHHFDDKRALFRAVFEEVDHALVQKAAAAAAEFNDPWERLQAALGAFFDACADERAVHRIVFIEAPAVLGWTEWRAIDAGYALGLVETMVGDLIDAGVFETRETQPLASILLGALNEAGMLIASSRDKAAAREGAAETFQYLLERLRVD